MKQKVIIALLLIIDFVLIIKLLIGDSTVALLDPQGFIAERQRNLILFAIALSSTIVIPVFILYFIIVSKYKAGSNRKAQDSDKQQNLLVQLSWWLIPMFVIFILAVVALKDTHALDPYKPISSDIEPVKIQVVALRWKWLFIYPEQKIASLNYVMFPASTPVNFELTADAPMNSFWIPSLGGQIYAMSGMSTKLHLIADKTGVYNGAAAEISGTGFAGMRFKAHATSREEFETWVDEVRGSGKTLNYETYHKLAEPSENNPVDFYSLSEGNLYNRIMEKFMPSGTHKMEH